MDVYDRTHRNVEERESMYENEIAQITAKNSNEEIYSGLLELAGKITQQKGRIEGKKKLYYISAEFLIGKLLSNNLINLGIYDQVAESLKAHGKSMAEIEEIENHHLEMADWDVWQPAFWIRSQRWDFREMVLV